MGSPGAPLRVDDPVFVPMCLHRGEGIGATGELRARVLDIVHEAAELAPAAFGHVFTNRLPDEPDNSALVERLRRLAQRPGARFLPVLLSADADELPARVTRPERYRPGASCSPLGIPLNVTTTDLRPLGDTLTSAPLTHAGPVASTSHRPLPKRPRRHHLVPVVIAGALLLTEAFTQAVTPFIRPDDWPFLVPARTPGVTSVADHELNEGRWLNTLWWAVVGQHGTPTSAAITYAVGYAVLVAAMWRVLHLAGIRPGAAVDALLGIGLYASAVWVQLLYWPGVLTPSVLVAAGALWSLPWAARSRWRLGPWLVGWEAAAVLTYPPVGVLLVVFAVVLLRDARWRAVLAVLTGWLAGFAVGVGVAYVLNWLEHGYFGIEIAPWRHPHPLTSIGALVSNTSAWARAAGALGAAQWWAAAVAVGAIVLGLRDVDVRPRMQRLLVGLALACGLDAAQAVITGVVTESRGQLWTWYVAVLPVALLLGAPPSGRVGVPFARGRGVAVGRPATAGLVVLAVGGVLTWRSDVGEHQATRLQYAAIAEAATRVDADGMRPVVVVYQDPALLHTREGGIMAGALRMAVRSGNGGVLPLWCAPTECRRIVAGAGSGSVVDLGRVGSQPRVRGVIVPTPPRWIYPDGDLGT